MKFIFWIIKKSSAKIVYKDSDVIAFEDINPKAPVHILVIPRKHIERVSDMKEEDMNVAGKLLFVAAKIAHAKNIEHSGYRLVVNCNKGAGQEVFHLHAHLLGGRKFTWPPG